MTRAPTLTRHLLVWALGTLFLLWAIFVYLGYRAGQHEADELTDGHLASVAALLLSSEGLLLNASNGALLERPTDRPSLKAHDYQQSIRAIMWNREGQVIGLTELAPSVSFDSPDGFSELKLGPSQQSWRAFTRWNDAQNRRVTVLTSEADRNALADDIAAQIGEPGWWLLPIMLLGLGLAIHRGLAPLRELSSEVHGLEVQHPKPLAVRSQHEELRATVDAINSLVHKYDQALGRERQLADTFAHELRTPLTALGLATEELRAIGSSAAQQEALLRVDVAARKANQVMAHLLALARAGRTSLAEAPVPVDLVAIARRQLADHVPAADAAGHELSYTGDEAAWVQGHPVLIEIAVRNLLENALGHAPAFSLIEVQVDADAGSLKVCDGPCAAAATAATAPAAAPVLGLGLGLGHQVIQRIAEVHGGRFAEVEPPAGFRRCYGLYFPCARSSTVPSGFTDPPKHRLS